jgi:hypothetical protein
MVFFSFKTFTTYFISALIGLVLSVCFNMLLFNVIDPGAKDTMKLTIKYMVAMNLMLLPKQLIQQSKIWKTISSLY